MKRLKLRSEQGASLVELTISLFLLALVLAVVFQGFNSLQFITTGGDRRLENLEEGRTLMAVSSKDIRTATRLTADTSPFVLAADREVIFYANLNVTYGPTRIHIYVGADSSLIEEVTEPDPGSAPNYTYNTQTPQVRFVGRYVANTMSQPIFTFYDVDSNVLPTPMDVNDPQDLDELLAIRSVGISLSIRRTTQLPVVATTLVNRVRLPNLDYNPLANPTPSP